MPNGSKIEFEGTLKYDGDDKAVTGTARQTITSWEKKRVKAKIEYGYAVDENGNPLGTEVRGGKGSVRVPLKFHDTENAIFTHVHPRGDGMLGGTFSSADLRNFSVFKNKTVRATAKEGTYSISKTKNFDVQGFNSYVRKCEREFKTSISTKRTELEQKYRGSKMTWSEYKKESAKNFNSALVDLHNKYSAGQKAYGYTYTLEKY